jgi:hypothetical protein
MNCRLLPAIVGLVLEMMLFRPSASASASGTSLADTLRLFPFQDSHSIWSAAPVSLGGDSILVIFRYDWNGSVYTDSAIYAATSSNGGQTWGSLQIVGYENTSNRSISAICLRSGGVLAIWNGVNGIVQVESDSSARTWSTPHVIQSNVMAYAVRLYPLEGNQVWLTYSTYSYSGEKIISVMQSTDAGKTWGPASTLASGDYSLPGLISTTSGQIVRFRSPGYRMGIVRSVSSNNGLTWSAADTVLFQGAGCSAPWPFRTIDGSLLMVYVVEEYSNLPVDPWGDTLTQSDVWYARSTDEGISWIDPVQLTAYKGHDALCGADLLRGVPFFLFRSDRWSASSPVRVWFGVAGSTEDLHLPPGLRMERQQTTYGVVDVQAWVVDEVGIAEVSVIPMVADIVRPELRMYDDGLHNDVGPGDNVYGVRVDSVYAYESYDFGFRLVDVDGNVAISLPQAETGYYLASHDTGNIALFVGSEGDLGNLGQDPSTPGARWPKIGGQQYLSKGSFWLGALANNVPFSISSDYISTDGTWSHVPTVPRVVPSGKADQEYILSYANSVPGRKSTVRQHSYQWSAPGRDDFIIFQYHVRNDEQTIAFQNTYAALWTDPDITSETGANEDLGGVDFPRRMIYLYDSYQNPPGMFGVVLLSYPLSGFVFYRIGQDPSSDADHYSYLSIAGITPATSPADYRMLVNAGPVTLSPGETWDVCYGIVLGNSLSELQANADTMIQLYKSFLTDVDGRSQEDLRPRVFALDQNFPNPFNPSTTIAYAIPASREYAEGGMETKLAVYDILGRVVSILVNERKAPGSYSVEFDGSNLASGVYVYRLSADRYVECRKMVLMK